ncbi:hypothetical protein DM01DRAFT_330032 [Hesseltinella vesiculosa]|uniref:Ndc10 domain-containing protein n=1 Tax=Hesseltinella vesiculosa TaxID=101127 RepID=A0A1X2G6Q7_9FUNG|nr:hypothetical protein DM01DRAFT_330032 [Hesseltinella vesiculosa]
MIRGHALNMWLTSRKRKEQQRRRDNFEDRGVNGPHDGYTAEELAKASKFTTMIFGVLVTLLNLPATDVPPPIVNEAVTTSALMVHPLYAVPAEKALMVHPSFPLPVALSQSNELIFDRMINGLHHHLTAVNRAFDALSIGRSHKTHAGNGSGARQAEFDDATEAQLRRLGHWNHQSMEQCYLNILPRATIMIMNGFPVFPEADPWLSKILLAKGSRRPTGVQYSISAERFLRLVIVMMVKNDGMTMDEAVQRLEQIRLDRKLTLNSLINFLKQQNGNA